jgi:large conductance mechanosensitive channel
MRVTSEFRDFIKRGNVIDLAVAVVLGLAFGKVVTSFVENVLMPPVGLALGRVDFANMFVALNGAIYPTLAAAKAAGAPVLAYGAFINAVVEFLLVALGVFAIVKAINQVYQGPKQRPCPYCTTAIAETATRCPACTSELPATVHIVMAPEAVER